MIPLRDNIETRTSPFVTWALIAANCYIFYLQISAGGMAGFDRFVDHYAVIPKHLFANPTKYWPTLFTAAFLHGGWAHIIGNMLFLHIFGDSVEDRMGHLKYLIFYLLVGALANGSQALMSKTSAIPLIGASGAIAGVLLRRHELAVWASNGPSQCNKVGGIPLNVGLKGRVLLPPIR